MKLADLAPGIVLMFETNVSRKEREESNVNLSGGRDLISTENHRDYGCNVLFADGHIRFIRKGDIPDLGWNESK
jgi:prepilin-type processing-associated H-X9-DG protein